MRLPIHRRLKILTENERQQILRERSVRENLLPAVGAMTRRILLRRWKSAASTYWMSSRVPSSLPASLENDDAGFRGTIREGSMLS